MRKNAFVPTLLISLLLCCTNLSLQAYNVSFRHIGMSEGLSQVNIFSIYQDEVGTMWFGTVEGLNRYNGKDIKIYRPSQTDEGLTQNVIYTITGNKKGALYIKAEKDLIHFNLHTQQFACIRKNDIRNIHFDNDTLWVVTNNDICYFTEETGQLHTFTTIDQRHAVPTSILSHNNDLWIGTQKGLLRISKNAPTVVQSVLHTEEIKCFYPDKKGNIWVGTSNGAFCFDPDGKSEVFLHHPNNKNSLSNNQVRSIIEDDFGNIWMGTFYGLNRYTPASKQWINYVHQEHLTSSLSHSSIFALYNDAQGTIWAGTYFGGINYFNPRNDVYNFYGANMSDPNYISFPFVGQMTEDKQGNLWICTEGGGLNYFNIKTREFTKYLHQEHKPNSIGHNNLKCIEYNAQKEVLYIGTHTGGLSIYDINRKQFRTLKHDPHNPHSIPNDIVNQIQSHNGNLVVLTQSGLSYMSLVDERFFLPFNNQEVLDVLRKEFTYETFLIDSSNRLWLAMTGGGVSCVDLNTQRVTHYAPDDKQAGSIGKFKVFSIFENSEGRVFFGTQGSGMLEYQAQTDRFKSYNEAGKHLASNYCYSIGESSYRYLIVLHNRGISIFDPVTEKLQYTYEFSQLAFNQGSGIYFSKDGEVYLSGTTGLMSFFEQQLYTLTSEFGIYFDKLTVNNEEVTPLDRTKILSQALMYCKDITLRHHQNNFIMEFATSDYLPITNHRFEYMLDGFDKEWLNAPTTNQITYTNINPGNYQLTIRTVDENQQIVQQASINIRITPPFYATVYAYILYALLIILFFYGSIRFNTRQTKLKASLEYERKEKERIEELNQIKLRFFTNISHEFRTPLTLIIGQVEALLQLNKLSPSIYNKVLRIYKNTQHMRHLISELLDFRKQEQGYLKLKVKHADIISFTKDIYMSFYEHANKQHISYKFESYDEHIDLWFDPVQLQKVIYNILSNAFKYTKENGQIQVNIARDKHRVYIRVKDNGVGIPKESIEKIFERFYQIDNLTSQLSLGTGIGLALAKGIVELHHGNITVDSQVGTGSEFTIGLLLGNAHFGDDEMGRAEEENMVESIATSLSELPQSLAQMIENEEHEEEEEKEEKSTNEMPSILIVEDNAELLDMLEDIFSPIYQVHRATNGKEGLEMAHDLQPDIVLSDVMMPIMSGKEMCYKIKNSIETSHIPVVLLTAQTSIEYTLEGYMFGADDYITKPFNVKLLISRCNNLIKTRRVLLEKVKRQQESKSPTIQALNEMDQALIDKATRIIHDNFDNPQFDMNALASELGMGRSKLYTKLKEVTGLTPNEFSLKLKLDEGMRLLNTNSHLTISEISYRIGFSSARYFSKCFKSFYGVPPLAVRKEKEE